MSKVIKSIKKGVKKVMKSPIGKALMIAAAVYTGGAALGAWKAAGALAKINGVLKAGKLASAVKTGIGMMTGGGASSTGGAVATGLNGTAQGASMNFLQSGGQVATQPGFLGRAVGGVTNFVEKNPVSSAMLLNAAASASSPNEVDMMYERDKIDQAHLRRQNSNLNVSNVKIPSYGFISRNGGQV